MGANRWSSQSMSLATRINSPAEIKSPLPFRFLAQRIVVVLPLLLFVIVCLRTSDRVSEAKLLEPSTSKEQSANVPNYCNDTQLMSQAGLIRAPIGQFLGFPCSNEFFHCRWQGDGFRTYKKNCNNGLVYDVLGTQNCNYDFNVKGCALSPVGWRARCKPTDFSCPLSEDCIPLEKRCDGNYDCSLEEDEQNCPMCPRGEFACVVSEQCVQMSARCNGKKDCKDGTDELDCNVCGEGKFLCRKSGVCIEGHERCNGFKQCPVGEDELLCKNVPRFIYSLPLLSPSTSFLSAASTNASSSSVVRSGQVPPLLAQNASAFVMAENGVSNTTTNAPTLFPSELTTTNISENLLKTNNGETGKDGQALITDFLASTLQTSILSSNLSESQKPTQNVNKFEFGRQTMTSMPPLISNMFTTSFQHQEDSEIKPRFTLDSGGIQQSDVPKMQLLSSAIASAAAAVDDDVQQQRNVNSSNPFAFASLSTDPEPSQTQQQRASVQCSASICNVTQVTEESPPPPSSQPSEPYLKELLKDVAQAENPPASAEGFSSPYVQQEYADVIPSSPQLVAFDPPPTQTGSNFNQGQWEFRQAPFPLVEFRKPNSSGSSTTTPTSVSSKPTNTSSTAIESSTELSSSSSPSPSSSTTQNDDGNKQTTIKATSLETFQTAAEETAVDPTTSASASVATMPADETTTNEETFATEPASNDQTTMITQTRQQNASLKAFSANCGQYGAAAATATETKSILDLNPINPYGDKEKEEAVTMTEKVLEKSENETSENPSSTTTAMESPDNSTTTPTTITLTKNTSFNEILNTTTAETLTDEQTSMASESEKPPKKVAAFVPSKSGTGSGMFGEGRGMFGSVVDEPAGETEETQLVDSINAEAEEPHSLVADTSLSPGLEEDGNPAAKVGVVEMPSRIDRPPDSMLSTSIEAPIIEPSLSAAAAGFGGGLAKGGEGGRPPITVIDAAAPKTAAVQSQQKPCEEPEKNLIVEPDELSTSAAVSCGSLLETEGSSSTESAVSTTLTTDSVIPEAEQPVAIEASPTTETKTKSELANEENQNQLAKTTSKTVQKTAEIVDSLEIAEPTGQTPSTGRGFYEKQMQAMKDADNSDEEWNILQKLSTKYGTTARDLLHKVESLLLLTEAEESARQGLLSDDERSLRSPAQSAIEHVFGNADDMKFEHGNPAKR